MRFSFPLGVGSAWRGGEWMVGPFICIVLCVCGSIFSGTSLSFSDISSMVLVLGGTFAAVLTQFSFSEVRSTWRALTALQRARPAFLSDRMRSLTNLSHLSRRDGMLVLEEEATLTRDPFYKLALELAVDSQDPQDIRRILETEVQSGHERNERAGQVLQAAGTYAPALGLIGTIIGLVQMLSHLGDAARVGPALAVALLTTLYGALFANLIFLPLAGKLQVASEEELLLKRLTIEGVLSLHRQENPLFMEQRFRSFQPQVAGSEV